MGIDLQEKSLAIFSQLKEKGGSAVQMYFGQVVDYSNSVYQRNIDALNAEISELEEAKSFGIVFEKKRLKQFRNLINTCKETHKIFKNNC